MLFLVVDDDALSRELLCLLLEAEGYEVEAAKSGEEAVARVALKAQPAPDVILTDMQMPGLAGEALATALHSKLRDRKTLLLAMSGSQPKDAALTAFDAFLLKPFSLTELIAMVSTAKSIDSESAAQMHPEPAQPAAGSLDAVAIDEESTRSLAD